MQYKLKLYYLHVQHEIRISFNVLCYYDKSCIGTLLLNWQV